MLFCLSLLPLFVLLLGFAALGPATLRHSDAKKGPAGTAKRLQYVFGVVIFLVCLFFVMVCVMIFMVFAKTDTQTLL